MSLLVVLCLLLLFAVAAIALDIGMLLDSRTEAQRAADIVALTGASVFLRPLVP